MPPGNVDVPLKSRETPGNIIPKDSSKLLSILNSKSNKKQDVNFPSIDPAGGLVKTRRDLRYKAAKAVISTSTTINHLPPDISIKVLEQYNNRIQGVGKIYNLPKVTMNYRVGYKKTESQFILKDNSAYTITKPVAFGGVSSVCNMAKPSLAISQDRMLVSNMPDTLKLVKDHSLVYVYPGNKGPHELPTFRFPSLDDAIKAQEQKRLDRMYFKQFQITRKKELTLPDLKLHRDNSIFQQDRKNHMVPIIEPADHAVEAPDRSLTLVPEMKPPVPENGSPRVGDRTGTIATINLGDDTPLNDIKDDVLRQRALTKNIAQKLANSSNSPGLTVEEHTRGKVKLHIKQNVSKRVEPIIQPEEKIKAATFNDYLNKPIVEPKVIPKPRSKPRLNPIQDHVASVKANIEKMRDRIDKQKKELQKEVEKRKKIHMERSTNPTEQKIHAVHFTNKSPYRRSPQKNSQNQRQSFPKEKTSSFLSVPVKDIGKDIEPHGQKTGEIKATMNTKLPVVKVDIAYTGTSGHYKIEERKATINITLPEIKLETTQSKLSEQSKGEESTANVNTSLPELKVESAETKASISYQRDFSRWHTDGTRKQSTFLNVESLGPSYHSSGSSDIHYDVEPAEGKNTPDLDNANTNVMENTIDVDQVELDRGDINGGASELNHIKVSDTSNEHYKENNTISRKELDTYVDGSKADNDQTVEISNNNEQIADSEQTFKIINDNEEIVKCSKCSDNKERPEVHIDRDGSINEKVEVRFDNEIEIRERTYEAIPPSMDGFSSEEESQENDLSESDSSVE